MVFSRLFCQRFKLLSKVGTYTFLATKVKGKGIGFSELFKQTLAKFDKMLNEKDILSKVGLVNSEKKYFPAPTTSL